MSTQPQKFIIIKDKAGTFRWRAVSRNGRIIGDSGEGYDTRWKAARAARTFCARVLDNGFLIEP